MTKLAFFYSIEVYETNNYKSLLFWSLKNRKPSIFRKKPATEEKDNIIGFSKLNAAVMFGWVIFLEIVRC